VNRDLSKMRMHLPSSAAIWMSAIALALAGCQGNGRIATVPVTGTVTVDGKPLEQGTITFETPGKRPASGEIKAGNIVNVMTYVASDGVPTGNHTIAITATAASAAAAVPKDPGQPMVVDANYMGVGQSLIPARYNNPATSGLTAEIKSTGKNSLQLELQSK
jgi:hypothetical protein